MDQDASGTEDAAKKWVETSNLAHSVAAIFNIDPYAVCYIWDHQKAPLALSRGVGPQGALAQRLEGAALGASLVTQSQAPPKVFKLLTKNIWRCTKPRDWALRLASGDDGVSARERVGGVADGGKRGEPSKHVCALNMATCVECLSTCGESCPNQRLQKRVYPAVKVVLTAGRRGHGLIAAQNIEVGDLVHEYLGEVIDEGEWQQRLARYSDSTPVYLLTLDRQRKLYVDASAYGSLARFINHSCDPNCMAQIWQVGSEDRVAIIATRPIAAGQELTYDYNLKAFGTFAPACLCGSAKCTGRL